MGGVCIWFSEKTKGKLTLKRLSTWVAFGNNTFKRLSQKFYSFWEYNKLIEPIYPISSQFGHLEVELSTVCVSKCFMCPRTQNDAEDKGWNVGHLDINDLMHFLHADKYLRQVGFCGAYGDPIYHPQFIEIIRRINLELPHLMVFTETNGSHKKTEWWEELAKMSTERNTYSFSIDGLADTNHIHRVDTSWESILNGVTTLRKNPRLRMSWKWILFRQNEHQVLSGYNISKQLGFNTFKLINSARQNDKTRPSVDFNKVYDSLLQQESISKML